MSYHYDDQDYPRTTPAVRWLIAINVAIYFLQLTLVGDDMYGALAFEPRDLTRQPWTIVTYMFVHGGLMHLATNMYGLWLFGRRLERQWGVGPFVRYYILCGLGGWLFSLVLSGNAMLLGASAAVFGVMLAYAMHWPDEEIVLFFLIPMKVKWLVGLYAALSLIFGIQSTMGMSSSVAHWAHLGGFVIGFIYLRLAKASPGLEGLRGRMSQVPDVPDEPPRVIPRSAPRPRERASEIDEVVARSNAMTTRRAPAPPQLSKAAPTGRAEALDAVLDKISQQGLHSLTGDERRLLEEMSKKLRNQ